MSDLKPIKVTELPEFDYSEDMYMLVSKQVGNDYVSGKLKMSNIICKCGEVPTVLPDPYESLPKNKRTVFHYMDVWTNDQPAHGVTPADMDLFLPEAIDHDGVKNGFWRSRDGVQNADVFASFGTHNVIDCDEISFFAQPLRQTLGRNGNQWVDGIDVRQSDLDGERMFQSKVTNLETFTWLYGSYYPWGVNTLWACFFPKGNSYTARGSGFQLFSDNSREVDMTDGWGLPTTDVIMQLVGQLPRHNELDGGTRWDDIKDFFFPDALTDTITNASSGWYKTSKGTTAKNISGLGLFPAGKLPNDSNRPLSIDCFATTHVMPTFKRNGAISLTSFAESGSPLHQVGLRISSTVAYAHGGNIRYARVKTADELGYKLVVDGDNVLFTELSDSRADLPIGMERGVALRYANREHRVVLKSWSDIQKEAFELESNYIINIEN